MEKIRVNVIKEVDDSFDIVIGSNMMESIADGLLKLNLGRVCLVTDATVKRLYGDSFHAVMKKRGIHAVMISLPQEKNDRDMKSQIEDIMLKNNLGRESVILAFGGGSILDLAGFVSATYYGGIPYLLLPTTLFSMLDHPIGGRVGVDTEYGRKSVGAYYRPKRVLIDTDFLKSLSAEALLRGVVEMLRLAIVCDERFFIYLEDYCQKLLAPEVETLAKTIKRTLEIRKMLLETDIKQLRFGTRMGHAFGRMGDRDWLPLGVLAETKIAESVGVLNPVHAKKIYNLLSKMGAPLTHSYRPEDVITHLYHRQFTLPKRIGKVEHNIDISEDLIKKVLEGMR